jgi:hypothetical protein
MELKFCAFVLLVLAICIYSNDGKKHFAIKNSMMEIDSCVFSYVGFSLSQLYRKIHNRFLTFMVWNTN